MKLQDLLEVVKSYNEDGVELVKKAYSYAEQLHKGQYRQSGEEYITHPLNVAYILAGMQADVDTICAGLLHDTLEDTPVTKEDIAHDFNKDIASLVDGVTKLAKMNFSSKDDQIYANTRKIITSITEDVRIIIIKLADRLHNMRTIEYKTKEKQKENAMETMDLFVPLAYYIGAYRIKSELEDLSLKCLYFDKYMELEEKKQEIERESKHCLGEMLYTINEVLDNENIPHEIKVRTKNIYGIYKKVYIEHGKISDIHDLLALKIMVDSVKDCYLTLGLVHSKYHPINNKFKDYIYNPKTNMYRSIHTTLFGEDNRLVQAQIRTFEMDKIASFGLTAYWDIYKGNARDVMQNDLKNKCQFVHSLKEIDEVFLDNKTFVQQVKEEVLAKSIYAYTPDGDPIELPSGSTAIDFAFKIHTDLGNTIVAAVVNDTYVTPEYVLHNNDRVRIITDKLSYGPKEEWLSIVKTTSAKQGIQKFYKSKDKNIERKLVIKQ